MAPSDTYQQFAYVYDDILGHAVFPAIRRLLDLLVERYPTDDRTHLDLACGTGLAMEYFARKGYRSTGVDDSLMMLRVARERGTRLVAGDLRRIPLRRCFSRITCLNDSINHLVALPELVDCFRSVRPLMNTESLFVFDMSDETIFSISAGHPYHSRSERHEVTIASQYSLQSRLRTVQVRGWVRSADHRHAIDETYWQRAYSRDEIGHALSAAALLPDEVLTFDPFPEQIRRDQAFVYIVKAGERCY
jgi:SAM-dependent methyltransferase